MASGDPGPGQGPAVRRIWVNVGEYRLSAGDADGMSIVWANARPPHVDAGDGAVASAPTQAALNNEKALADAFKRDVDKQRPTKTDRLEDDAAIADEVTTQVERGQALFLGLRAGSLSIAAVNNGIDSGLALIQRLDRSHRYDQQLRVARALSQLLAVAERWLDLLRTLQAALRAAKQTGNQHAEAWALHELGTLRIAVGQLRTANDVLSEALKIRQDLGDRRGAAATMRNITVLCRTLRVKLRRRQLLEAKRLLRIFPALPLVLTILVILGGGVALAGAFILPKKPPPHRPPTPHHRESAAVVTAITPTSGPPAGGTLVTIKGDHLTSRSVVLFGTHRAKLLHVIGDPSLLVAAPPGRKTVPVRVQTGHQLSPLSGAPVFTYKQPRTPPRSTPPRVTQLDPVDGPAAGGTPVTLTGSGLDSVTKVLFGRTPGTDLVRVSDTKLTVASPAGSGSVAVTIETTRLRSTSLRAGRYRYVSQPLQPTITRVVPATGPAAGGTPVVIDGEGLSGVTNVQFGSERATDVVALSETEVEAVSPRDAAGTVNVTATTTTGTAARAVPAARFTYVSAPPPVPTLTALRPDAGPAAGGTEVTLTGTDLANATTVLFGSTSVKITHQGGSIEVETPAGTAGKTVDVTAEVGRRTTNPRAFTYHQTAPPPAPTITSIEPAGGPATGGNTVTIAGTGLATATAVSFGSSAATHVVAATDGDSLTAIAPAGAAGASVPVTVITPQGTAKTTGTNVYTYRHSTVTTITSITPGSGPAAGGNTVTITGTNLTGASSVTFDGTPATNLHVALAGNSLTVTAPAGTAGGTVPVAVTTPTGPTAPNANSTYTYQTVTELAISSIVPNSGPAGGGNTVTISGTDLTGATAVTFGSTPGTNITVASSDTLTVTAPAGTAGSPVDVTVTTPAGTSKTNTDATYTYTSRPPIIDDVTPDGGPASGGTLVKIVGSNLAPASAVTFGTEPGTDVTPVLPDGRALTVRAPAGTPGHGVQVTVTTPAGNSTEAFTYHYNEVTTTTTTTTPTTTTTTPTTTTDTGTTPTGTSPTSSVKGADASKPPTIAAVSPAFGPSKGGTTVMITGTNLTGASGVTFDTAASTHITAMSDTTLTATAPAGAAGPPVNVTVTTPAGTSTTSDKTTYTYTNGPPTIEAISPDGGPATGGTVVKIIGSNLAAASAVTFGTVAGTGITQLLPAGQRLTVVAPVGTPDTLVQVTVTTPAGSSTQLVNYHYSAAPPTITNVSPAHGPAVGGNTVTITGSGLTGATGVTFGAAPGVKVNATTDTTLTVTAPGGAAGPPVDVTVTTPAGISTASDKATYTYDGPVLSSRSLPEVGAIAPHAGPATGGTLVMIRGADLERARSVFFGLAGAARFKVVSNGEIEAMSPVGNAGENASVVVITAAGRSKPGPMFAYLPAPESTTTSPVSTTTSPAVTTPNGGDTVTTGASPVP